MRRIYAIDCQGKALTFRIATFPAHLFGLNCELQYKPILISQTCSRVLMQCQQFFPISYVNCQFWLMRTLASQTCTLRFALFALLVLGEVIIEWFPIRYAIVL